jgi:hypothetical protein
MASRINDAMGYLGDSDERYETGIVGGSLLFVAEHVYLFSGRSHLAGIIRDLSRIYGFHGSEALLEAVDLAAVAVGFLALTVPLGFLLTVVRDVSTGSGGSPTFLSVDARFWLRLAYRGTKVVAVLGTIAVVMFALVWTATSLLFALTPPVSARTLWVIRLLDVFSFLVTLVVVFYVPYVLLAGVFLLGMDRDWSGLGPILVGTNRRYPTAWGLLIMLLLFNSDVASFVFDLVVKRWISLGAAGTESVIAAFATFYLLVAIVYLFADALSDPRPG